MNGARRVVPRVASWRRPDEPFALQTEALAYSCLIYDCGHSEGVAWLGLLSRHNFIFFTGGGFHCCLYNIFSIFWPSSGNHGLYLRNTKSFILYLLLDSHERDLRFLPFQSSYPSAVAHSDVPHMLFNVILSFFLLSSWFLRVHQKCLMTQFTPMGGRI